jgi:hypothetical protein
LWDLKNHDLGGLLVNFTKPGKSGLRFVELTMAARGSSFVR